MAFRDPIVYDDQIVAVSLKKLISGQLTVDQYIESSSYSAGVSGWRINGNGNAEFNDVVVRGELRHPNLLVDKWGVWITEEQPNTIETRIAFRDSNNNRTGNIYKRQNGNIVIDTEVYNRPHGIELYAEEVYCSGKVFDTYSDHPDFQLINATHPRAVKILGSDPFTEAQSGNDYPIGISMFNTTVGTWGTGSATNLIINHKWNDNRFKQESMRWDGGTQYWRGWHTTNGWTPWKQYT